MQSVLLQSLKEVSQSKAVNNPVMGSLVKERQTIPNNIPGYIGEILLAPRYSVKQSRRIKKHLENKKRKEAKFARKQLGVIAKW